MVVGAPGLSERGAGLVLVPEEAPVEPHCSLDILTHTLSALLARPFDPRAVYHKAVGLGLLGFSQAWTTTNLTLQTASRLLLAGYRVPAAVVTGSLPFLGNCLRAGWRVFVPLERFDAGDGGGPALFRVSRASAGEAGDGGFVIADPGGAWEHARWLDPDGFARAWAVAGRVLIVAADGWDQLPRSGNTFVGGSRGREGVYHWDSAECDTDGQGIILRF
jgi:hypothetical protein